MNLPDGNGLTAEQIGALVRGWFFEPFDSMGYRALPSRWGTYWNNGQVYVSELDANEVPEFLRDLKLRFAGQERPVSAYLDHEDALSELGPLLMKESRGAPTTIAFLAHMDPEWKAGSMAPLTLKPVSAENLRVFAETKLRAWMGDETSPLQEDVEAEEGRRARELTGSGRGLLAFLDEEPAGYIWWHEDPSRVRWISQIATRLPFRRQGVARALMAECIRSAYEGGNRALVLDVDVENEAALALYRGLGFTERVYTTYEFEIPLSGDSNRAS
jgi:ribosomal protein S18 acetylase RimI-like enzyme